MRTLDNSLSTYNLIRAIQPGESATIMISFNLDGSHIQGFDDLHMFIIATRENPPDSRELFYRDYHVIVDTRFLQELD